MSNWKEFVKELSDEDVKDLFRALNDRDRDARLQQQLRQRIDQLRDEIEVLKDRIKDKEPDPETTEHTTKTK